MSAALGLVLGAAFGALLAWGRLTDYDVIHGALVLRDPYVFLVMGAGVGTGALASRLLRAGGARVAWTPTPIAARHIWGSAIFGLGWALAGTCPGPVAAQLGQGRWSALFTMTGLFLGITLQARVAARAASAAAEPVT